MHQSLSSRPKSSYVCTSQPICIQNYKCRFLDYQTNVHSICSSANAHAHAKRNHIKDINFYTVPMTIRYKEPHINNVMLSFVCPSQAEIVKNKLDIENAFVVSTSLQDLSYHACLLKIPLVTIVNAYCEYDQEHYEILYTTKYLNLQDDYFE